MLDTNVLVSAMLSPVGPSAQVLARWRQGDFDLLVSEPILTEYGRALGYDRVRSLHGLDDAGIAELVRGIREFGVLVEVGLTLAVVADDPADDKFVECAVAGGADYVVSGDAHLLALRQYQGIQMLSPRAFLTLLGLG